MGKLYHRPLYAVDYGQVETSGSGVVLGDNNDGTLKRYYDGAGSVLVYPAFTQAVPSGRQIIAVRAGHHQRNNGLFGLFNGWVMTYLRIDNVRKTKTRVYVQDGYSDGAREVLGEPLYKDTAFSPWTKDDITLMSTDSGAATGEFGPDRNKLWCACSESYIVVIYDEPVPVPVNSYPANGATITTSNVSLQAKVPAPQYEQPVLAVFQLARDSEFTQDLRTFTGDMTRNTTATATSNYVSRVDDATYTNLGPGTWYMRSKGRDYRNSESAWGATTSFTIQHGALPVPSLAAPTSGTSVPTPYGVRTAAFASTPTGDRRVGVTFQFCRANDFSSSPVVAWSNTDDGFLVAASTVYPGLPWLVGYNAEPNPSTPVGKHGSTVALDDPSQYLSQGTWYARVRATDVYGQSGNWSTIYQFTVSHPPVGADAVPGLEASFDQRATPVRWTFADPWSGDSQSAYRMKVTAPDGTTVLQDTGKVPATVSQATMDVPDTYLRQRLAVLLTVWDRDDVPSQNVQTSWFRLSKSPVITCPFPSAGEQIVTGQPTISWSVVFAASGITQKSFEVKFLRADTGAVQWSSGTIPGTAMTFAVPRPVLKNMTGYQLALTVTDSESLSTTLIRNFSTNFIRPDPVPSFADATGYDRSGYVLVDYRTGVPDAFFFEWRIYRRKLGQVEWTQVGAVQDPTVKTFRDWSVAGADRYQWCVTQAALRFGSIVESEYADDPDSWPIESGNYWLIVPDNEALNFRLPTVVSDKYTDREETNEYVIIGGGKRRNRGTWIGKEGSLSAQVRHSSGASATEQVAAIRRLKEHGGAMLLRDPFGNITQVSLGEVSIDRIPGVGSSEFVDLEIPYFEVM